MFRKLLIANRGEIACRIIRTARRLGIGTVAVYSEADAGALHVRMADEAVAIGPAPSSDSYLALERVVDAAKRAGADAVHPGFGFLAENAAFARALAEAGIVFVGPGPAAIAAMGDKLASKKLAERAGVNIIPGHAHAIADVDEAARVAAGLGYPVMIKASAGGGGKGMRAARDEAELRDGFDATRREARSAFGDDRILIERFIAEPRHVEIQVLADSYGNAIHLNERECSIQRRHQKVIEEAPSPLVGAELRRVMGAQAVALARAVDYVSAGTVEFVVGPDRQFYFLEMNTRLQVEHPVTEMTAGLDLVEQMIRIAAGERLAITQDQVPLQGWAIEARVYAEDPSRGFLPSVGRLTRFIPPAEGAGVRVDAGVAEGDEITRFYDPMIAKLIVHDASREAAIARMRRALDRFVVHGVRTNIAFLAAVLAHPRFADGRLSTGFIAEVFGAGYDAAEAPAAVADVLAAVAAFADRRTAERAAAIGGLVPARECRLAIAIGAQRIDAAVSAIEAGYRVALDSRILTVASDSWRPGLDLFEGRVDGREVAVQIRRGARGTWQLVHGGAEVEVLVRGARAAELAARMPAKQAADLSKLLLSPMPGLMVSLAVADGDQVKAGEPLCVIDAMKMENVLRAERDGTVAEIKVRPGDSVAVDQVLMTFE
ncbi:MAG TPA: acetyl/propionyl/methylcrotonyl-CoA carboxylase subunit alpha [Alphaproteobacteria bacterium]